MKHPNARSAAAWAVAITAPVAVAMGAALGSRLQRRTRRVAPAVPARGIHDVPARPALWRTGGTGPIVTPVHGSVSPVPPENPHAPPTPASGSRLSDRR